MQIEEVGEVEYWGDPQGEGPVELPDGSVELSAVKKQRMKYVFASWEEYKEWDNS